MFEKDSRIWEPVNSGQNRILTLILRTEPWDVPATLYSLFPSDPWSIAQHSLGFQQLFSQLGAASTPGKSLLKLEEGFPSPMS